MICLTKEGGGERRVEEGIYERAGAPAANYQFLQLSV